MKEGLIMKKISALLFIILGLPAPGFLLKFFGLIRDSAGKLVELTETKEANNSNV